MRNIKPPYLVRFSLDLLFLLLFRVLLDVGYVIFVHPKYEYMNFFLDISYVKIAESYLILGLLYWLMPKDRSKLSMIISQILFLVIYVPIQSYYSMANESREWFYLSTVFWVIVFGLLKLNIRFVLPKVRLKHPGVLTVFIAVLTGLSFFLIFWYMDFTLNLDFSKVYEVREKFNQTHIPMSGYLINWMAKIFLPFLLLTSLFESERVKVLPVLLTVLAAVLIFSSTGHKSYLLGFFMALGIAVFLKIRHFFLNLNVSFVFLITTGLGLFLSAGHLMFASMFTRRLFFLPAQISFFYHETFGDQPVYLSHSILRFFMEYPHELEPAHYIGKHYFGKPENSANNGLVTDGYTNFGSIGVMAWAILFFLLLKLADSISENKNKMVIWPLLFVGFFTFVNGALFTTLLTHGLIPAFLIAYLYPEKKHSL